MAAPHCDGIPDGFAIGDARFFCFDTDAEARRQPLQRDAQMHFSLAQQFERPGFLLVDNCQRWVFIPKLVQCGGKPHLILPVPDPKGEAVHCARHANRGQGPRRNFCVRKTVAGCHVLKPAEGERVAFFRAADFDTRCADQPGKPADTVFAVTRTAHLRAVREGAAQNPRQ